jgi:hypothetical protein
MRSKAKRFDCGLRIAECGMDKHKAGSKAHGAERKRLKIDDKYSVSGVWFQVSACGVLSRVGNRGIRFWIGDFGMGRSKIRIFPFSQNQLFNYLTI